jgi:hypothetical protein
MMKPSGRTPRWAAGVVLLLAAAVVGGCCCSRYELTLRGDWEEGTKDKVVVAVYFAPPDMKEDWERYSKMTAKELFESESNLTTGQGLMKRVTISTDQSRLVIIEEPPRDVREILLWGLFSTDHEELPLHVYPDQMSRAFLSGVCTATIPLDRKKFKAPLY